VSILIEVAKELLGMFLADAALSTATIILIAVVAVALRSMPNEPLWGGALLFLGCLAIVAGVALCEARKRRAARQARRGVTEAACGRRKRFTACR
jgi:hypothetical protein